MRKVHAIVSFAAAVCLLPCHRAGAVIEYKKGEGWSTENSNGEDATEATASAQFQKAQSLENAGNYRGAMTAYHGLGPQISPLRAWRRSRNSRRGRWRKRRAITTRLTLT